MMVGLVGFRHDSAECNTPYSTLVVPKAGFGVFRYVGKEPISLNKDKTMFATLGL